MLIIKNIELAKHCFRDVEISISSSFSNKSVTLIVPASFRCGCFSKDCIERICLEVSKWVKSNCEEEMQFIDSVRNKLEIFR